jgi:hypothetical protein
VSQAAAATSPMPAGEFTPRREAAGVRCQMLISSVVASGRTGARNRQAGIQSPPAAAVKPASPIATPARHRSASVSPPLVARPSIARGRTATMAASIRSDAFALENARR